tara:strand:+ start:3029 stop:3181 length:153 start_codon:yes stop_codon:yes gene_type:complete
MKRYTYFIIGFMTAIFFMVFMASCTSTLEAEGWSGCGDSEFNPCYMKIVE